jgi:uncharacterized protein YkwD
VIVDVKVGDFRMTEPGHGGYSYPGQPHSKTDPLANRAYWGAGAIMLLGILVPVLYFLTVYGSRAPSQPGAVSAQEQPGMSAEEDRLLNLINEARAKEAKKPPLKPDPTLCRLAREHAANMARQRMPSDDLDGKKTTDRILDAGYKAQPGRLESNQMSSPTLTAEEIFQEWMKAPQIKSQILDEQFTETGIGIARGDDGIGYGYQVLAAPVK